MKALRNLVIAAGVATVLFGASEAHAARTIGKITFIGSAPEEYADNAYSARFRIRVNGICDNDNVLRDRWIVVRSGRMDGVYAHNAVNMRNAYSTLLAAFLAGREVELHGLSTCSTATTGTVDLWNAYVSIL